MDRSYAERQRYPGDAEAVEGMGRIADQKMEHLVASDKGIIQYRKKLRKLCRDLDSGVEPDQVGAFWPNPIPTYGGDTVLYMPAGAQDDSDLLVEIGERVMQIQYDAESLQGDLRDQTIVDALKSLEAEYRQ